MTQHPLGVLQMMPSAEAKALLDREPVKNARALLRYALPINNKYVRQMQVWFISLAETGTSAPYPIYNECFLPIIQATPLLYAERARGHQ